MIEEFEKLIEIIKSYDDQDFDLITKAYNFALNMHDGQMRESGEPYIIHPVAVATILAKYNADKDTICAALLHDCIEDTDATYEQIKELFGQNIALLVNGVTNLSKADFGDKDSFNNANIRKLLKSMILDIRVLLIKIADRLHNMRTLNYKKDPRKQSAKSLETMAIYVPFALIMGLYDIKLELEDYCFSYLKPEDHRRISTLRYNLYQQYLNCNNELIDELYRMFEEKNIPVKIKFRMKGIYSTYKRLANNISYEDISDLIIYKVIVDDLKDCYKALISLNEKFLPIPGGMEDFITHPKGLYRAFRTNVYGPNNQKIQFQIQTQEMETLSMKGITAFWSNDKVDSINLFDSYNKIIEYIERIDTEASDDKEFVELIKGDVLSKKIEVFDESNKIVELPAGSTVLDFAYYIHSDIGNNMVAAIIDGDFCTDLGRVLKPREHVRIITDELSKGPQENWHYLVRTKRASKKVNEFLNKKRSI